MDSLGVFLINKHPFHIDPYNEENLGFFKKISYNEKLKELNEAEMHAYTLLREVADTEYQKYVIWGTYKS